MRDLDVTIQIQVASEVCHDITLFSLLIILSPLLPPTKCPQHRDKPVTEVVMQAIVGTVEQKTERDVMQF